MQNSKTIRTPVSQRFGRSFGVKQAMLSEDEQVFAKFNRRNVKAAQARRSMATSR